MSVEDRRRADARSKNVVELLEDDDLDHVDDERADGDAPDVAHAAEDDHRQDRERDREQELVRARRCVSFEALNTPARPAVVAPRAKASSLVVTVLMPLAAAASSSSRIAFQARPIRESCSR